MQWPPVREDVDVHRVSFLIPATGGLAVWTERGWLLGLVVNAPAGASPANVALFDGGDVTGVPYGTHQTTANGNMLFHVGLPGWPLESGLFIVAPPGTTGILIVGADR